MSQDTSFPFQKADRYEFAVQQYRAAFERGFYLEAITLCESMISDRLLSSLDHRLGVKRKAKQGLFKLIEAHLDEELLDTDARALGESTINVFKRLDEWREERNGLLHGFAKCIPGEEICSSEALKDRARAAAEEGMLLFRMLDNWHRREVAAVRRHARGREAAAHEAPASRAA
jgi:hypothetical protein